MNGQRGEQESALSHAPVLLAETVDALSPRKGAVIVDGTFGRGGHSRALLAAGATVIGLDRDPDAQESGARLATENSRFRMLAGRLSQLREKLAAADIEAVDGVLYDLGVSSPQLDEAGRGFSFKVDGPLDMRMEKAGESAADLLQKISERALADLLHFYGDERQARRIARAIAARRNERPFTRTADLAEVVRAQLPKGKPGMIDPATRSFQALRIAVNDEMGELSAGLTAAEQVLRPGGRLAVISFHSHEDRMVKQFLQTRAGRPVAVSRHVPEVKAMAASFRLLTRKPVIASEAECAANPRARSAKLRTAERTEGAAHPAFVFSFAGAA